MIFDVFTKFREVCEGCWSLLSWTLLCLSVCLSVFLYCILFDILFLPQWWINVYIKLLHSAKNTACWNLQKPIHIYGWNDKKLVPYWRRRVREDWLGPGLLWQSEDWTDAESAPQIHSTAWNMAHRQSQRHLQSRSSNIVFFLYTKKYLTSSIYQSQLTLAFTSVKKSSNNNSQKFIFGDL